MSLALFSSFSGIRGSVLLQRSRLTQSHTRPLHSGCCCSTKHHDTLGVGTGASQNQIKEAYLKKLHETHPDKSGLNDDSEFLEVKRAFAALSTTQAAAGMSNAKFMRSPKKKKPVIKKRILFSLFS